MNEYLSSLSKLNLEDTKPAGAKVLDLFAGCGGLALGFEAAGFETIGYEWDEDAVNTYNKNLSGACYREYLTDSSSFPNAEVIIGGPPCQPFSVSGNQRGIKDSRDGFPAFIQAVHSIRPKIWMFENVRGMFYRNRYYLNKILQSLTDLDYRITANVLNVKNYGVPQNRERLIVFGHIDDFNLPRESETVFTAGHAVSDIAFIPRNDDVFMTKAQDEYVAKYERASKCINPRDLHLDRPARTLTCRNLAGATGDMHRIKMPDGRRKRLNEREAARLQSFPDWFQFTGSKSSVFQQLGNAVPPLFSLRLALTVKNYLYGNSDSFTNDEPVQTTLF